jgi:hypothetical protein
MAVISGHFLIEIQYNKEVKELIRKTNEYLREQKKIHGPLNKIEKYKNLLKIELNFHRDFNLTLDL